MKGRSALPRVAFLLGLVVVAGGVAGSIWGRKLLASIDYFDVRQVEVVGARWVPPDSLLRLAAIGGGRSVWDDHTEIERRLIRHPLIDEAHIRRSGLRRLRVVVREVEPVALVGAPELRVVRGDGTLLPIDPVGTSLDLPLLTAQAQLADDSTRLREGPALRALVIFARLQALDPGLASVISDFELALDQGLLANLTTSQPVRRLALPSAINETLVRRVRATLADLRSRGIAAALVEARYADQIVVRREQR
jgi:cell division septal protein FtsQ